MKIARGDVVLVEFPFSGGTGAKLRPAVVVQSDRNNERLESTILAPITSNTRHFGEPTQVLIDPASESGQGTGLLKPSAVKCENLATIEARLVRRKIGACDVSLVSQLDAALKAAIGLV